MSVPIFLLSSPYFLCALCVSVVKHLRDRLSSNSPRHDGEKDSRQLARQPRTQIRQGFRVKVIVHVKAIRLAEHFSFEVG